MAEPETVSISEFKTRVHDYPLEPSVIVNCREYRDSMLKILPEYLFRKADDRSVFSVIYADDLTVDDLTGYERAVLEEVLELTYKVEMWRLANNRQNYTEIKAIESRMRQFDCGDVVLVDSDNTGDPEQMLEEMRQDDGVKLVE